MSTRGDGTGRMRPESRAGSLLSVVDLFAGCGGLSLGLEQAGFTPVYVNELNDDARATYLANRVDQFPWLRTPSYHSSDIKDLLLNRKSLAHLKQSLKDDFKIGEGEIDLIVGGPPCQGFSGIGHRRSYSVQKEQLPSNHLFQDMAAVIHRLMPRAFLFENVRGLLNSRWTESGVRGEIWSDVVATFSSIPGYRIAHSLVFAKDYGVPQNRPRVLLVGLREDVARAAQLSVDGNDALQMGFLPLASGSRAPGICELLDDLVDSRYANGGETLHYPRSAKTSIQRSLRTPRLGGNPLPRGASVTEHSYSKHSAKIQEKFSRMIESGGRIPTELRTKKFAQRVLPRTWGSEGPTITATSLPDDYVHYSQPRTLTVREWARLQTFPDWYEFKGKRHTGGVRRAGNPRDGNFAREVPKYTQIGNAVPVQLAEAVGKHLAMLLRR